MAKVKNRMAGRPPALDPATHRYMVRFNSEEHNRFLTLYERSGVPNKATFIKARVFNENFKVVKIDSSYVDYYRQLSAFYAQFRGVANNYNQLVVALKSNFPEKKALAFLYRLERATLEMTALYRQIITLTEEFKKEWLQRSR